MAWRKCCDRSHVLWKHWGKRVNPEFRKMQRHLGPRRPYKQKHFNPQFKCIKKSYSLNKLDHIFSGKMWKDFFDKKQKDSAWTDPLCGGDPDLFRGQRSCCCLLLSFVDPTLSGGKVAPLAMGWCQSTGGRKVESDEPKSFMASGLLMLYQKMPHQSGKTVTEHATALFPGTSDGTR